MACPKTMAGVGHLNQICKDGFRVASAVQETFSSEMLRGQATDFLKEIAFWSIRSSGLRRCFCLTGAALCVTWPRFFEARYFRQKEWKDRKTHWHEAVSSALNFPFLKEVSQNCFVFVVVNFENPGSRAELFRF